MPSNPVAAIVLAAGKGTRMKSDLPKVLHPVGGLPMVEWVGRALREAKIDPIVMVVGHGGDQVRASLGDKYAFADQGDPLGTGHAVLAARQALSGFKGSVLVVCGDTPLVDAQTFQKLLDAHEGAAMTVATFNVQDPTGYGRIVRDRQNRPIRIVEHKDAAPDQLAIREVNAGLYIFDSEALFSALPKLTNRNKAQEYYLTDVLAILAQEGREIRAAQVADEQSLAGVNDRWQLSEMERVVRRRILRKHALNGVTIQDPDSTYIGADVEIGLDTLIFPGTIVTGDSKIGAKCEIGPYTHLIDVTVGDESEILFTKAKRVTIGSGVKCGPYANLRPNSTLGDNCRIGNFVEINRSTLQDAVKASHLTYLGDAIVGSNTNVGAGTITCNFDGFDKNRTTIGANVFVGSNSTLVAPLTIGDNALTAAGSVVTNDVPADAGAFGRARQETKPDWAQKWRKIKQGNRTNP